MNFLFYRVPTFQPKDYYNVDFMSEEKMEAHKMLDEMFKILVHFKIQIWNVNVSALGVKGQLHTATLHHYSSV